MRTAFDFAPFRRSTVGFDRLFDMLENSSAGQNGENYPPFDLVRLDDNKYRIEGAAFLTPKQRRGIYYDNAARFLRLDRATIAADYAR